MSSYKMVEKVRYTASPQDVVALKEYIVFFDEETQKKQLVFKLANNLSQRLYGLRFEISQYDDSDALLEKSTLAHDKFSAGEGETFVPSAKLTVHKNCKNIRYKLLMAAFDKVKWENGAFADNDYVFERYVKDEKLVAASSAAASTAKNAKETKAETKEKEKAARKEKNKGESKTPFAVRDVSRKNVALFPAVYRVFISVVILALVGVSAFVFVRRSNVISVGDYDLKLYENNCVGIYNYDGKSDDVKIPAQIGEYTVTRIETGAFRKSGLQSLTIESPNLTIARDAFVSCKSLTSVEAAGNVTVAAYGFNGCGALARIYMPASSVAAKSFYKSGSSTKSQYTFGRIIGSIQSVFGEPEPTTEK